MYRLWSSGVMVSSSWFIRGMPRVVTLSTWVSPRWNRAEPWAVGNRSTSAESGRISDGGPSVDPEALLHDPPADQLLGQAPHGGLELAAPLGELGGQGLSMMKVVAASRAALRSALATILLASVMASVPTAWTRSNTSSS